MTDIIVNIGIPLAYILIGGATILAIVFPGIKVIKEPAHAKGALLGLGGMLVVFLLGYLFASDEAIFGATGNVIGEGFASRITGTGIITFYVFIILAVGSIIFNEVTHLRNR